MPGFVVSESVAGMGGGGLVMDRVPPPTPPTVPVRRSSQPRTALIPLGNGELHVLGLQLGKAPRHKQHPLKSARHAHYCPPAGLEFWGAAHNKEGVPRGATIPNMKTPYIPHYFGPDAKAKASSRSGWLTVGVVSSIPWPEDDVWLQYDGGEYFLHGVLGDGEQRHSPCISTPLAGSDKDGPLSRLYRFTSILGYFKRGYVDITESCSSGHIMRISSPHDSFTTLARAGKKAFNCNYMPIVEDDQIRKALVPGVN